MPEVSTDREVKVLQEHVKSLEDMLASTTNYMMEIQQALEASRKALYEQNRDLEQLVAQRTARLERVVADLEKEVQRREQAQHSLSVVNAELNTLLYRSSHDFKGPICSALGLLSLMEGQTMDEEARQYMKMLPQPLQRLERLTRTITSIAEFRQSQINRQRLALKPILIKLLEEFSNQWSGTDVSLAYHFKTEETFILSDEFFLESMLRSLLDNAFRYRIKGREHRVVVKVEPYYKQLKLSVIDNGTGIDKAYQHRVFDMFFRGSELATGSGLGLYVSRLAVEKMGGKILLNSNPGKGTEVRVYLPGHIDKD